MKVVILSGGLGTRLSEETTLRPKPMIEIGGKPILWHIMSGYAYYGFNEFVVALGYKGEMVKEYFLNYYHHQSDLTINLKTGKATAINRDPKDWKVHLIDTGDSTMTGGRIYRLRDNLKDETFMLTYGDGLSDVNIKALLKFHRSHGKIATVTAVRPIARFGEIKIKGDKVVGFKEKPQITEGWINGGFFIFNKEIFKYLSRDTDVLEGKPLETLAKDDQLMVFKHEGFWHCMDTVRDKQTLERLWDSGQAAWKVWR